MKKFIDEIYLTIQAGNGGKGAVSFERAKFKPKGKPDGGDGGDGGNIIAKVNPNFSDLSHLIHLNLIRAQNGGQGGKNNKKGKDGNSFYIELPPGCIIKNRENNLIITELLSPEDEFVIAHGGKGGHGNAYFKSSTNRSPHNFQPGKIGETLQIIVELKILAQIGLVGYPNAGKSTLLKNVTDAEPKIADYPFTTLSPNLGIFYDEHNTHYSIADIPGLIDGASEGKGLGIQFLKHVERTRIIALVIDATQKRPKMQAENLLEEVKKYNPNILSRKIIVVINKIDLVNSETLKKLKDEKFGYPTLFISALKKINLDNLKKYFIENLK